MIAVAISACSPGAASAERGGHRVVSLLHTADLHSHLLPEKVDPNGLDVELGLGARGEVAVVGGVARLATLVDEQRRESDVAVLLDSGDVMEGTAFFTYFGGVPELRSQEALGVDAAVLGNHDVAAGAERLIALRREWVTFPLLGANLPDEVREGLVMPSATIERGGLRIVAIGVGRSPDHAPGLDVAARAVQREIDELSPGADLVVVLSHLGRDADLSLVPRLEGVDIVLGGHTHDVLAPPRLVHDCGGAVAGERGCVSHPVLVVHSGAYGRYVGRVDAELSGDPADLERRGDGRSRVVVNVRSALVPVNDTTPERADVAALLEPYRQRLVAEGLDAPFAFAPVTVTRSAPEGGDSSIGNLVAGAMLDASGASLALVNTTGLRADILAGPVTPADLFRVLPFDDELVTLTLSGDALTQAMQDAQKASCARSLKSQVQVAGVEVVFDCTGSALLTVGGRPVTSGSTYRVATASFLAGSGQWLDSARLGPPEPLGVTLREAVEGVLRARARCNSPGNTGNLPCIDAAAGARVDGRVAWR